MTRDTVIGDTPACRATSLIVGAPPARRDGLFLNGRSDVIILSLSKPAATARVSAHATARPRRLAASVPSQYDSAIRTIGGVTDLAEDRHWKDSPNMRLSHLA